MFTREVWWQIGGPGLMAMLMAPVIFWILNWIARITRYPYLPERTFERMNRRRLSPRLRIQFVGLLMLLGMGALGLRLWWIQVAHGAEWTAQIRGSSQATVRIPSVRGEIKDRNGADAGAEPRQLRSRFLSSGNGEGLSRTFRSAATCRTSRDHQRDAEGRERARHHQDRERRNRAAPGRS